jgi:kynurenine 3-monooxygenase
LGGRGITALQKFGVWEDVKKVSVNVPGRKDWTPQTPDGAETMLTNRKFTPYILPRDKLVSVLYQHIQQNYGNQITVQCRTEVYPVDFEYQSGSGQGESVVVDIVVDNNHQGVKEERVVAELVLVADGNARTFAQKMEELDPSFEIVRYIDDNPRVYKSVSFRIPGDWRFDLNYSVRSNDGRVNFDALPANEKGDYVGILLVKGDDEMARGNIDPVEYRAFLEEQIPQIVPMLTQSDIELMASKESSTLPRFRYIRPRMHQGKRTILLGDCAKTVKPYFGMGANSALEDVKVSHMHSYLPQHYTGSRQLTLPIHGIHL